MEQAAVSKPSQMFVHDIAFDQKENLLQTDDSFPNFKK